MNAQNEEQTRLLKEILKWTKFAGMKQVKEVLTSVLDTEQKKLVYQLSDGSRGMIEIGNAASIASTSTISRYWKSWVKLGLGQNVSVKGGERFTRDFDLEDFGIEVTQVRDTISKEKRSDSVQLPESRKEEKQIPEPITAEKSEASKQPQEESHD